MSAQAYHPFPTDHAVWWQHYMFVGEPPSDWYYQMEMSGDTILENVTYKKVCIVFDNDASFVCGLREDSLKRVYCYSSEEEVLLYDFNVSVGDTVYGGIDDFSITDIDSVEVDGVFRKTYLHNPLYSSEQVGWVIEGIGSEYGLMAPLQYYFEEVYSLCCFSSDSTGNDLISFTNSYDESSCGACALSVTSHGANDLKIFPNPAVDRITINHSFNADFSVEIIDCLGRPARSFRNGAELDISSLASGIYLVCIRSGSQQFVQRMVKE